VCGQRHVGADRADDVERACDDRQRDDQLVVVPVARRWYPRCCTSKRRASRHQATAVHTDHADPDCSILRAAIGVPTTTPLGQDPVTVPIAGLDGIPIDATAIIANVTVTEPTVAGYVSVYPTDADLPDVSNTNFPTRRDRRPRWLSSRSGSTTVRSRCSTVTAPRTSSSM